MKGFKICRKDEGTKLHPKMLRKQQIKREGEIGRGTE